MISDQDIARYLARVGKRGHQLLELVSKLRPFVEMQQTDLGCEFLKDDLENFCYLLDKIVNQIIKEETPKQEDCIALRLTQGRLQKVYDRLQLYNESIKTIKSKGEIKDAA